VASGRTRRQPHGSVGAAAGQRAIAQSNSVEIADALLRYSAPEEVCYAERILPLKVGLYVLFDQSISYSLLFLTGDDFPIYLWNLCRQV
jgi:hypothetical protein